MERTKGTMTEGYTGTYYSNGSAAVKPQERRVYEPKRTERQSERTQERAQNGILQKVWQHFQDMPVFAKIEIIACVAVVIGVLMLLMVQQIMVASVTAENNALIRNIDKYQAENGRIVERVDRDIDMTKVGTVIEENGLVPYADNSK